MRRMASRCCGCVSFATEDCAASVENMLLAVTALGYATVWLDGVLTADFQNLRLRDVPTLTIDRFNLSLHIGSNDVSERPRTVARHDRSAGFQGGGEGLLKRSFPEPQNYIM